MYKNGLKYKATQEAKKNHPEIFDSPFKTNYNQFKEYIFDRKRWWFIALVIFFIFLITIIFDIGISSFICITNSTSRIIVDQRTANIAVIVSITLVVVGFLINNLAIKNSYAYHLLFKHSYLYPIIYLTLSLIGGFFVVSTLRDSIDDNKFTNVVVIGTLIAICVLFLIGFLFRTIIMFTDRVVIKNLIDNYFFNEAKKLLKEHLIKIYSGKLFKELMINRGAKEYNLKDAFDFDPTKLKATESNSEPEKEKPKRLIKDFNLNGISKYYKRKSNTQNIIFDNIIIGETITRLDNYIWERGVDNTPKEKRILKRSLKTISYPKKKKDPFIVRKYYEEQIENFTEENRYRELDDVLESFLVLYDMQMKNQEYV